LIDIYPTLIDLCDLPPRDELEGKSLRPLLIDPKTPWDRPSLTTHKRNNHALRSERFRYIRYADGSEELYDHAADPLEWQNIAGDPAYADAMQMLTKWFPTRNAPRVQ
jgi:arylsulfatase A-like enzyme